MKMKQEHFDEIKQLSKSTSKVKAVREAMVKRYETGDFDRPLAVNDLNTFLLGYVLQRCHKQDKCTRDLSHILTIPSTFKII